MSTMQRLHFGETAEKAARATDQQLHERLGEIGKALPGALALDSMWGTDAVTHYSDEAGVLRRELDRRPGFNAERRRVEDPPQAPEDGAGATIRCPACKCRGGVYEYSRRGRRAEHTMRCDKCGTVFCYPGDPDALLL